MKGACCYSPKVQQTQHCKHWSGSRGVKHNFSSPMEFPCLCSVCSGLFCRLCQCHWRRSGDRPGGLHEGQPPVGQQKQAEMRNPTSNSAPVQPCQGSHLLVQLPQPATPSWSYLFILHDLESLC